jgi:sugar phosphate isomerase/epimerase
MYQYLPKSYKGFFPFRIATTSFIYPDDYVPNVKMLGQYLDEIELLFFESQPKDRLPSEGKIKKLSMLAEELQITYNVHLPTDISLGDQSSTVRQQAVETLKHVLDLVSPLSPSNCTLHLSCDENFQDLKKVKQWQKRTYQSILDLVNKGAETEAIAIETLNYPMKWVEEIITKFDLMICIDLGHIMLHGFELDDTFRSYFDKTNIIHLHGVQNGRDHYALDRLSKKTMHKIIEFLKHFYGIVSLEVFSYQDLATSLTYLEKCWHDFTSESKNL